MNKFMKIAVLVLVVMLSVTVLLTGCGTSGGTSPTPSTAPTSSAPASAAPSATDTPTATPSAAAPVTLKWYVDGGYPFADQDKVYSALNDYLKQKMNVTLNVVGSSWGDFAQKMNLTISSGEEYDLCFTSNWANNFVTNVANGAFVALNDMLPVDAPQTWASVPKAFWDAATVNGKIYAVPNQQVSARCADYLIPADDAQTYGLDQSKLVPGDLSSLNDYLARVHAGAPKEYINILYGNMGEYYGLDMLAGWNTPGAIYVKDNTLKVVNQFDTPEFRSLQAQLEEWNKAGYMDAQRRLQTPDDSGDEKNHLIMLDMGGTWKPGGDVEATAGYGYPLLDIPGNTPILSTGSIQATMTAISVTSKNPDKALQLVELMNTDQDAYMLLNYGIKGDHWDLDSNGFLIAGPNQANYYPNTAWMFATNYLAPPMAGQPKDIWQQTKDYNNSAIVSPAIGFSFNPDPVATQIAQCNQIINDMKNNLNYGITTAAEYDDMISQLKAAGSDQIVAEMQKQLDAWSAAKSK